LKKFKRFGESLMLTMNVTDQANQVGLCCGHHMQIIILFKTLTSTRRLLVNLAVLPGRGD
jgi:hypothetical protein